MMNTTLCTSHKLHFMLLQTQFYTPAFAFRIRRPAFHNMLRSLLICSRSVAPPINSILCYCKLSFTLLSNVRTVLLSHSQTLFPQYAFSQLKPPEADITPMPKLEHGIEPSIRLLKNRGLTDLQIAKIMRIEPYLIRSTEKILEPKLQLLEDFGFVDQNLSKLLIRNPRILNLSLKHNLLSKLEFLKDLFQSDDALVQSLLKYPRILSVSMEKTLKPSLAFWEGWGFSAMELVTFLKIYPALLTRKSLFPSQVDFINKIGANKKRTNYKHVVRLVAVSRVETLEAKIENFKLCGLSAEETCQLFRSLPQVFCRSKESIIEKMYFVVNNMELPANYVVKHPSLLQISLEKTIKPRFLVWQKIKFLDGSELSLLTVLTMKETRFVNKIIKEHPESKLLWTIYENAIYNASKRTMS